MQQIIIAQMQASPEGSGLILLVIFIIACAILSTKTFLVRSGDGEHVHEFRIDELVLFCLVRRLGRCLHYQADKFLDVYHYLCCCNIELDDSIWKLTKVMACKLVATILMRMALKYFALLDSLMDGLLRCLRTLRTSRQQS